MITEFNDNQILFSADYGRVYFVIPSPQKVDLLNGMLDYRIMISFVETAYEKFFNSAILYSDLDTNIQVNSLCEWYESTQATRQQLSKLYEILLSLIRSNYINEYGSVDVSVVIKFMHKINNILENNPGKGLRPVSNEVTFPGGSIVRVNYRDCKEFSRNYMLVFWPNGLSIPKISDYRFKYIDSCFNKGRVNLDGEFTLVDGTNCDMSSASLASETEIDEFFQKFFESDSFEEMTDSELIKQYFNSYYSLKKS